MAYIPDKEMKEFWERETWPTIRDLTNGQCQIPEIRQRHSLLVESIEITYDRRPNVAIHDRPSPDAVSAAHVLPFGCRTNNGQPEMAIFVPALKIMWEEMRRKKFVGFRQRYQTAILIGFIHELDHINLGFIWASPSIDQMIHAESVVWGSTCEHTIRPLVDNHHLELCHSDQLFYSMWVKSGRNVNGPQWKGFVASLYTTIKRAQ